MGAALDGIDKVDEAVEPLKIGVIVLYRYLEFGLFLFAGNDYRILEEDLFALIEIFNER